MRILANDGISKTGKEMLEAAGYTIDTEHRPQDQLAQAINDGGYEILLVRSATKVDNVLMDACPGLKMVGRGGVGLDNVDKYHAKNNGIIVFNTPEASSRSVAELVVGSMFTLSRSLHDSARNLTQDDFGKLKKKYSNGIELRGKSIGIIGFGRIGQELASYAIAMGMDVFAVDLEDKEVIIPVEIYNKVIEVPVMVRKNFDVVRYCDFVSVHIPKQPNGDSAITYGDIELMKDGVIIINTSRGGVVNEDDLLDALETGKVAAAALDVFEDEPKPNPALLNHPKIFATPHIGAATVEAQYRIGTEIADIITAVYGTK